MFNEFSEEARKIMVSAKEEMYSLKHPYVGSEHLLLAILKNDNDVSKKLKESKLTYDTFKSEIVNTIGIGSNPSKWFLYTPLLKRIIENAIIDSKENNNGIVTVEHLFIGLLEEGEGVAIRILLSMNIDIDELYQEFSYKIVNITKCKKSKKLLVDELGYDLNKKAKEGCFDPVVGRNKEIQRLLEILCRRTKNNPILIGDAGVGKTAIVEELSRLIVNGDVPLSLRNKRIVSLDMATLVAGTKYRGEFEERMRKLLKEIEDNDDIILFIDEIHTLVGAGGAEGAIDASNIFKPALSRGKIRVIGATTTEEYKKFIENDKALERRFQKIVVKAPSREVLKHILMCVKENYEKFHNVIVEENIIDLIVNLSNKYIYDRNEPDRSIDVLDEVCSYVSLKESDELKEYNKYNKKLHELLENKNNAIIKNDFKLAASLKLQEKELMDKVNNLELTLSNNNQNKKVTKEDIAFVINAKTGIPVYELLEETDKMMSNFDKELKSTIYGQERAIKELVYLARRIKLGYKEENSCYSIMFCGPSGVGKTCLAKKFGAMLVGEANVIKIDASEYVEAHTISKIVGAPPGYVGYTDNKNILEEIKNKPYSVLIIDEIEKANPAIINLFFQILDDGKIKDSKGTEVRFDNVTIIMTSNIGYENKNLGFINSEEEIIMNKLKDNFSIPFINRIDNLVMFNYLNEEVIKVLVEKKLEDIKSKYETTDRVITYNDSIKSDIVRLSNYNEFGARKLDKLIKEYVENPIIQGIIENKKEINIDSISDKVLI